MQRALTGLLVLAALVVLPASALAQSAGDDQYVDPFQGGDGGAQEQPAQAPAPSAPEPVPDDGVVAADTAEAADAADTSAAALPRTGLPLVLVFSAGYALLLGGIAIRRQTR